MKLYPGGAPYKLHFNTSPNEKTKPKHTNLKTCVGSHSKQMRVKSRKWNGAIVLNLD